MPDDIAMTLQVTVPIPEDRREAGKAYLAIEDALTAFREAIQTVNGTVVEVKPATKKKYGPQTPEARARVAEAARRHWASMTQEQRRDRTEKMRVARLAKRNGPGPAPAE